MKNTHIYCFLIIIIFLGLNSFIQGKLFQGEDFEVAIQGDEAPESIARHPFITDPEQRFSYFFTRNPNMMIQVDMISFQENNRLNLPADIDRVDLATVTDDGTIGFVTASKQSMTNLVFKVFLPSMKIMNQATWDSRTWISDGDIRVHDDLLYILNYDKLSVLSTENLEEIDHYSFNVSARCNFDLMNEKSLKSYCHYQNEENDLNSIIEFDVVTKNSVTILNSNSTDLSFINIYTRQNKINGHQQLVIIRNTALLIYDLDAEEMVTQELDIYELFNGQTIAISPDGKNILSVTVSSLRPILLTLEDNNSNNNNESGGTTSISINPFNDSLPFPYIQDSSVYSSTFKICRYSKCPFFSPYGITRTNALIFDMELRTNDPNITVVTDPVYHFESTQDIGNIKHIFREESDRILAVTGADQANVLRIDMSDYTITDQLLLPKGCLGEAISGASFDDQQNLFYVYCIDGIHQIDVSSFTLRSTLSTAHATSTNLNAITYASGSLFFTMSLETLVRVPSDRSFPPSDSNMDKFHIPGSRSVRGIVPRNDRQGDLTHVLVANSDALVLFDVSSSSMMNNSVVVKHRVQSFPVYDPQNDHFLILESPGNISAFNAVNLDFEYSRAVFDIQEADFYFRIYFDQDRIFWTPPVVDGHGQVKDDLFLSYTERQEDGMFGVSKLDDGNYPVVSLSSDRLSLSRVVLPLSDNHVAITTKHGPETLVDVHIREGVFCNGINAMESDVCHSRGVCTNNGCKCSSQFYGDQCQFSCDYNEFYSEISDQCIPLTFSVSNNQNDLINSCQPSNINIEHNLPNEIASNVEWQFTATAELEPLIGVLDSSEIVSIYSQYLNDNLDNLNNVLQEFATIPKTPDPSARQFSLNGENFLFGFCYWIELAAEFLGPVDSLVRHQRTRLCFGPIQTLDTSLSRDGGSATLLRSQPLNVEANTLFRQCSIKETSLANRINLYSWFDYSWSSNLTDFNVDGSFLTADKYQLQPNEQYYIEYEVKHREYAQYNIRVRNTVQIAQQPLIAQISGGNREISPEPPITLDGSKSFDPDRMELPETYLWSCVSGPNCNELDFIQQNDIGSIVRIENKTLNEEAEYQFQLDYSTSDGRSDTARITLFTSSLETRPLSVSISSEQISTNNPIIDIRYNFVGLISNIINENDNNNNIDESQLKYEWNVIQGSISFSNSSFQTPQNASTAVIRPKTLNYGEKYRLRVSATAPSSEGGNQRSGFAEINFTPQPPLQYDFELKPSVSPSKGEPLKTQFELKIDANSNNNDSWKGRVRFNYGYSPRTDNSTGDSNLFVSLSGGFVYEDQWQFQLPIANRNVTLRVMAQDVSSGVITPLISSSSHENTITVSMTKYNLNSSQDIEETTETLQDSVSSSFIRGQIRQANSALSSLFYLANEDSLSELSVKDRQELIRNGIQSLKTISRLRERFTKESEQRKVLNTELGALLTIATDRPEYISSSDNNEALNVLMELFTNEFSNSLPFVTSGAQILVSSLNDGDGEENSNIKDLQNISDSVISIFDRFENDQSQNLISESEQEMFTLPDSSVTSLRRLSRRQLSNSKSSTLNLKFRKDNNNNNNNNNSQKELNTFVQFPGKIASLLESDNNVKLSSVIGSMTRFPLNPFSFISNTELNSNEKNYQYFNQFDSRLQIVNNNYNYNNYYIYINDESDSTENSIENRTLIIDPQNSVKIELKNGNHNNNVPLKVNNLENPIEFTMPFSLTNDSFDETEISFMNEENENENEDNLNIEFQPQCIFFNYSINSWSTEGCKARYVEPSNDADDEQTMILCRCSHLSTFSVGMERIVGPAPNPINNPDLFNRSLLALWIGIGAMTALGLMMGICVHYGRVLASKRAQENDTVDFGQTEKPNIYT